MRAALAEELAVHDLTATCTDAINRKAVEEATRTYADDAVRLGLAAGPLTARSLTPDRANRGRGQR
jgi:hypothetical protein